MHELIKDTVTALETAGVIDEFSAPDNAWNGADIHTDNGGTVRLGFEDGEIQVHWFDDPEAPFVCGGSARFSNVGIRPLVAFVSDLCREV